jgi:hypothetical protein
VRALGAGRYPIVAIPGTSPAEVIDRQYRDVERARAGRVFLPSNARSLLGPKAEIGVDMSHRCAAVADPWPVAGIAPETDAAIARPTTGADVA